MPKRKVCVMCGRHLPSDTKTTLCRMCISRHVLDGPCPRCDGKYHLDIYETGTVLKELK